MTLLLPMLLPLLAACSGDTATPPVASVVDDQRAWLAACESETANFEACRAYCSQRTGQDRTDCFFQLAEHAPLWSRGDARLAVNVAYSVCNSSPDFGPQCFRHSLHEIALTCNPKGVPWLADPTFQAGNRWAPWQACVAKTVLQRQKATCLPAVRSSYHNMWEADDAPLCGM
jgi:hypothetical protein